MSNALIEAINASETVTENGMSTFTSSMNSLVDLFFVIGASRGKDIIPAFSKAYAENPELAIRIALWARDVRGGAGERQLFRDIAKYMVTKDVELARRVMAKIPELGRWDDMYVFFGTALERDALRMIAKALDSQDGLCAKWMDRKGPNANKLRAYLQKTPKQYRKLLVELTNVVETAMCSKNWDEIDFAKLPSLAAARYQQAFGKHAPAKYAAYKSALVAGDAKINANAVYPYDIVKSVRYGDKTVADAQWKALPDYLDGSKENFIAVVDTSGSMTCGAGGSNTISCLDVAMSLGLYLSERSRGAFKDAFITFSERPQLQVVKGSLSDRVSQMSRSSWGMNTDLEAVFKLILNSATQHKVPAEDMPTTILILSDMQFDQCARDPSAKAIEMISHMYQAAGYTMPKVVFWNINAKAGVPTTFKKSGTALVSGFSPAIMSSILGSESMSPINVMMDVIMNERYSF